MQKRFYLLLRTVFLLVALSGCDILFRQRTIVMEGPSMEPTIHSGQEVAIERVRASDLSRGDIIVFANPSNRSGESLLKRVIGLPGEEVEIEDGRVFINGQLLEEPYVKAFCQIGCDGHWTLGNDQYFVLGDNRRNSYDSHSFGPIGADLILYRVLL
jgi:signal peptidase I